MKQFCKFQIQLIFLISLITSGILYGGSYLTSKPNGLGIRVYDTGVRGIGMGRTGLASFDSVEVNNYGITQWLNISLSRTSIGAIYNLVNTELSENTFTTSTADLAKLNVAIPLQRKKMMLGVTLQPYTFLDFKSTQPVVNEIQNFDQNTIYSGSISRAQLNFVWSPTPVVGFSINGNLFFGQLKDRFEFRFNNTGFSDTFHEVNYKINGPGIGFNLEVRPTPTVKIAGFVDLPPSLNISVDYSSASTPVETQDRNFDTFPLHFGIGSALKLGSRWQISGDFSYQAWSEVQDTPDPDFEDWYHAGFGFERSAKRQRGKGVLSKIDFRGGVSFTQLGYKFNNESVSQKALHFGLGLPFAGFNNRIDIAFSGGMLGDNSKNLFQETFFKVDAALSIGELWFQRVR